MPVFKVRVRYRVDEDVLVEADCAWTAEREARYTVDFRHCESQVSDFHIVAADQISES